MDSRVRCWSALMLIAVLIAGSGTFGPRALIGEPATARSAGHGVVPPGPLAGVAADLVFVVDSGGNTGDADPADDQCADGSDRCTLRAAIQQANATPGQDVIAFEMGSGPQTIAPLSALPEITDPVTIDGSLTTGYSGTPLIALDGSQAGVGARGLAVSAGSSTIRALQITNFEGAAIEITGNGGNTIAGNVLGGNASSTCGLEISAEEPLVTGLATGVHSVSDMNDCGALVGDGNQHRDRHRDGDQLPDGDGNTDGDPHGHADSYTDADKDGDPNGHGDGDPDVDRHTGHRHADRNPHSHCNHNAHGNDHANHGAGDHNTRQADGVRAGYLSVGP